MRKLYFILIVLSGLAFTAQAQKKKAIQASPKSKTIKPPPRIKKQEVVTEQPPPANNASYYPSLMADPKQTQFDREKDCSDCDTLVLEPGKPHIILYDIKWMSNPDTRSYRPQPTAESLKYDYYAMQGLVKREWEELHHHYPEHEFIYHHIYRNTFIKIRNKANTSYNLLNRQEQHEGLLYWGGKAGDAPLLKKEMVKTTEAIAYARGVQKASSYYKSFRLDSLRVNALKQTRTASPGMRQAMNTYLSDKLFGETVLPLQLFDLKNVKSITLQSEKRKEKTIRLTFNEQQQLISSHESSDKEATRIEYAKDGLPLHLINEDNTVTNFYYHNDTLIVANDAMLHLYQLKGGVFFPIGYYNISTSDYNAMSLAGKGDFRLLEKAGESGVTGIEITSNSRSSTTYSNTTWQLPLNITENQDGERSVTQLSSPDAHTLTIEAVSDYKSMLSEFKMKDGRPLQLSISIKRRGDEAYKNEGVQLFSYEYFK